MAEQRLSPLLHSLVSEMLRMLITYEIELTAYNIVIESAQDRVIQAGIPWDMRSNVRKILASPALAIEAEAEYAPFAALLQKLTPENLEVALASIRRKIAGHNASIPPQPQ
jgi:3-deoxy-D-manno-octulosonic-acid transferase